MFSAATQTVVVWSFVSGFLLLSKRCKNHNIYECACHSLWCWCKTSCEIIQIRSSVLSHPISTVLGKKRNTRVSQMKTSNIFYLVIYWTQKVHNDFIFLCILHCALFHSLLCGDFPSLWLQLQQCPLWCHYLVCPTKSGRLMPFMNFLVHSYACCSDRHSSPYWTFIHRWISVGFTPSVLKKWMTERCSSLAHVVSGAAIFTILLLHRVAFLHRTATCWPLFKPSVSLLSTYKTIELCFELLSHFYGFSWLSLMSIWQHVAVIIVIVICHMSLLSPLSSAETKVQGTAIADTRCLQYAADIYSTNVLLYLLSSTASDVFLIRFHHLHITLCNSSGNMWLVQFAIIK